MKKQDNILQLSSLIPNMEEVVPCEYKDIRTQEYDAIIAGYLAASEPEDGPVLMHMAGIPGAGKTTFYHSRMWPSHVFIAFDDIMESIQAYQDDLHRLGAAEAFARWELAARVVGYELLRQAVEKRKNIFFDNGASSQAHLQLMQNVKKFGYKTEMYYISCSLETAIARAQVREKEINRHIPVETIQERYVKTLNNVEQYRKAVDRFYHFDSTENTFAEQAA